MDVAELDGGEDGGADRRGGGNGEGDMQAVGEGLAGGPEQQLSGLAGEPSGRCRCGGAAPTARSAAKVSTGASARPPAMTKAGRIRRASTGVSMDPRMNPAEEGSIRPARSSSPVLPS